MTIDEAIAQAREVAEEQRKACDLAWVWDNTDNIKKCAEEHEQLAEWLEELKKRRSEDYGYMADIHESIGYRKAVDDAMEKSAKAICIGCGYLKGTKCTYTGCNCAVSKPMLETVMKVLEQLKSGVQNDRDKEMCNAGYDDARR